MLSLEAASEDTGQADKAFRLQFPLVFQEAKTRNLPKGEFGFSNSHFCLAVGFDHQMSLVGTCYTVTTELNSYSFDLTFWHNFNFRYILQIV